jgi:hypothetical protein
VAKRAPKKPVASARGKPAAKAISPKSGAEFAAVIGGLKEVTSAVAPALRAFTKEPRKCCRVTKAKSRKRVPMFFRAVMMFKG